MATTLMPLDPATSPQRAHRLLTISARLLPGEVVAARRARQTRAAVIAGLLVVIVLLGGWYAYASYQTSNARDERDGVAADAQLLRQQQAKYTTVVNVQNETKALETQLATLMAKDLRWSTVLRTLTTAGVPHKVLISSVDAQLTLNPGASAGVTKLPSTATGTVIGTITITGKAPSKPQLARYVEALSTYKAVANPYLTTASEPAGQPLATKSVDFNLQLDIMSEALGGRFTKKAGGN